MRVGTGMKRLDSLLSGGYPEKSVVLLSGGPGTGKTLLGLKFLLEGAKKGEKCCYITLSESKEELLRACESVQALSGVKKHLGKSLAIEHIPMGRSEVNMKRFVDIMGAYPKIDRIVIDNVNKLLLFSESDRLYRAQLSEIINGLKKTRSSLLLCETDAEEKLDSGGYESFECDGVVQLIFLELEEKPMRALVVHKMRYTNFDPKLPHELVIDNKDVRLTQTRLI
jgi:circadian clock protein KaiC